jgi:hypothetical protein
MLGNAGQDIGEPVCGSMSFILAATIRLYITAARSPNRSKPQKNRALRPKAMPKKLSRTSQIISRLNAVLIAPSKCERRPHAFEIPRALSASGSATNHVHTSQTSNTAGGCAVFEISGFGPSGRVTVSRFSLTVAFKKARELVQNGYWKVQIVDPQGQIYTSFEQVAAA